MRILVLSLGVPFPPMGGGLTRTFHLLQALAPHHELVLAAFAYGEPQAPPPFPVRVETVPWRWSTPYLEMVGEDAAASARAYRHLTWEVDEPWFSSVIDPDPMTAALERLLKEPFDLILLEGAPLAKLLPALPRGVPRVLDLFDVHSLIAQRALASGHGDPDALAREADRTVQWERQAVRQCNACLTVSEAEAVAARALLDAETVRVVPNGVDTASFVPQPGTAQPGAILFTGRMSYEPNVEAACHFARDILPLVRRQVPHASFHVVGAGGSPRLAALSGDAVTVYGRVDDVRPHHRNAEVVVVPVRSGGGTRIKVLEAAAAGKAIVSTSLGIDGLDFRHGRDLLVADSCAGFAGAVVSLLENPARRAELGAHARAVACRYDWAVIGASFRQVLERLVRS